MFCLNFHVGTCAAIAAAVLGSTPPLGVSVDGPPSVWPGPVGLRGFCGRVAAGLDCKVRPSLSLRADCDPQQFPIVLSVPSLMSSYYFDVRSW